MTKDQIVGANMYADVKEGGSSNVDDEQHITETEDFRFVAVDKTSPSYPKIDFADSRWKGNKLFPVYVSFLELPSNIYVHLATHNTNRILDLVDSYEVKELHKKKNVEFSKNVGRPCLAYFIDRRLYRAKIIGLVDDPNKRKILYVDYGNKDVVDIEDIFFIPDEFLRFPEGATLCLVKDLLNAGLDEERLKNIFEYTDFQCQMLETTFDHNGSAIPLINLFGLVSKEPIADRIKALRRELGFENEEKSKQIKSNDLADVSKEYRHCICYGCAEKFAYIHQDKSYMMCSRECLEMVESFNLPANSKDRDSNVPSYNGPRSTKSNIVDASTPSSNIKGNTADVLKTTFNDGQGRDAPLNGPTNATDVKKRELVSKTDDAKRECDESFNLRSLGRILDGEDVGPSTPKRGPIEYGQDGVKGDLLPLNHEKDIKISPKLVDGATVKILYFWSTRKILICAVEDEDTIHGSLQMDIDNLVKKYDSDLTLNHIPILFDYYLGKYNDQYYRGTVTKCDEERCRVHFEFVDLGDNDKLDYTELRMLTQELMNKHPIYSKCFGLFNVPSPSYEDPEGFKEYLESRISEVYMGKPLKLEIVTKRKMILTDEETGKNLTDFYHAELMAYKKMKYE